MKTLACTPNDWDDVELHSSLEKMYPLNHKFSDHELQTWNAILRAVGCTNITPFSNKISPIAHSVERYVRLGCNITADTSAVVLALATGLLAFTALFLRIGILSVKSSK
ncbi:4320_t:CDS:2 [Entrophospora sp. SA101]|nr:4320_t:CDS:2 [Entrophospora sp. SA101]